MALRLLVLALSCALTPSLSAGIIYEQVLGFENMYLFQDSDQTFTQQQARDVAANHGGRLVGPELRGDDAAVIFRYNTFYSGRFEFAWIDAAYDDAFSYFVHENGSPVHSNLWGLIEPFNLAEGFGVAVRGGEAYTLLATEGLSQFLVQFDAPFTPPPSPASNVPAPGGVTILALAITLLVVRRAARV